MKKAINYFNQMDAEQQQNYKREFFRNLTFYRRKESSITDFLNNKDFENFEQFLKASFDWKKSMLQFGYWFWVSIQYNIEFPVPDEVKRFGK